MIFYGAPPEIDPIDAQLDRLMVAACAAERTAVRGQGHASTTRRFTDNE